MNILSMQLFYRRHAYSLNYPDLPPDIRPAGCLSVHYILVS